MSPLQRIADSQVSHFLSKQIPDTIRTPEISKDDEKGDLFCQEHNLTSQIQSQNKLARKHRD